ncbi:MAG: hypothetical protein NVSMB8_00630 [Candidatus Limnocylindrales bacterium]
MLGSGRSLTARQQQVLDRVAQGKPNKQIAVELAISERAVKALVTRLFGKLGVQNRAALIATVLRAGAGGGLIAASTGDFAQYLDAPFMITVLRGPRYEVAFVNRMFESVSGVATEALLGRELDEVFPDAEIHEHPLYEAVLATGIPGVLAGSPSRWRDARGQIRSGVFHTLVHPLRGSSGSVDALLTVTTAVEYRDQQTV